MQLNEYDDERELLKHADLNFDGFEDVQLLQYYHPHLGTALYCVYVWDEKRDQFRHEPEIPNINPIPHPSNRTITVHQDWFGGVYSDRIYRWTGSKAQLIEENGRLYGSDDPNCGFTDYCSRLIQGRMADTAQRKSGCSNRDDVLLVCPVTP